MGFSYATLRVVSAGVDETFCGDPGMLLDNGADPQQTKPDGAGPLFIACMNGRADIVGLFAGLYIYDIVFTCSCWSI